MAVKYKMTFVNAQEITCVVNFIVDDDVYSEDPIVLYGGSRPFVLSEFNQNNDFFKPIRPQQATIEILASASGAELEDFITEDDDRQIKVRFDFGGWVGYWYGILSQEDMSEIFIAQNHIITLRADEGFGVLKTIPLQTDIGQQLTGTFTPFALIQYAATETVRSFLNCYIYSNLFHSSMNSGSKQTGIDQCCIDVKTFETSPGVFEDSYTVIEKINSAFNQTLFQYRGNWWIVRQEELFIPSNENLTGFQSNKPTLGQRANANTRYTISVGVNKKVKPVMPEMLKTFNKPSKDTTIIFKWDRYPYIICNQSFDKGELIGSITGGSGEEIYTVSEWKLESTSISTPTIIAKPTNYDPINYFYRSVFYSNYKLQDDFVQFFGYKWMRSCNAYVNQADSIDVQFQFNIVSGTLPNTVKVAAILLYANDGTKYSLSSSTRAWTQWTTDNQITFLTVDDDKIIEAFPIPTTTPTPLRFVDFKMTFDDDTGLQIEPTPKSGYINVLLYGDPAITGLGYLWYKDLNIIVTPSAQRNRRKIITSDGDQYTITGEFKKNTEKEIFLSDSYHVYKGAIFQTDGFTLTNGGWSRRRISGGGENLTFKKQNAIANWIENRRYKLRLEANFFGLIWDKNGSDYPIGLVNTINFSDDLPAKTFAIVNLKEIDFMSCIWSANLLEIWDDNKDDSAIPGVNDVYTNEFYYE